MFAAREEWAAVASSIPSASATWLTAFEGRDSTCIRVELGRTLRLDSRDAAVRRSNSCTSIP